MFKTQLLKTRYRILTIATLLSALHTVESYAVLKPTPVDEPLASQHMLAWFADVFFPNAGWAVLVLGIGWWLISMRGMESGDARNAIKLIAIGILLLGFKTLWHILGWG